MLNNHSHYILYAYSIQVTQRCIFVKIRQHRDCFKDFIFEYFFQRHHLLTINLKKLPTWFNNYLYPQNSSLSLNFVFSHLTWDIFQVDN